LKPLELKIVVIFFEFYLRYLMIQRYSTVDYLSSVLAIIFQVFFILFRGYKKAAVNYFPRGSYSLRSSPMA